MQFLQRALERFLPTRIEAHAERRIKSHQKLWNALDYYRRRSPSTGCSYSDYATLYKYIKKHKPKEVLECGTGFSTLVIMQALIENEEDYGIRGHLVSMEENEYYYRSAAESLPAYLKSDPRLEILLSPAVEDSYEFFRGVRYRDVPKRPYEFVWVDGPDLTLSPGGVRTFNCDFIKVVGDSERPVGAMVDTRKRTSFVYSILFPQKFRYDYLRYIGVVDPVTKKDLPAGKEIVSRLTASHAFRWPRVIDLITGNY